MILRIGHSISTEAASGEDAWPAFVRTQQLPPGSTSDNLAGCISQSAHAALAAQLAKALKPDIFGPLRPEVIDAIGSHDAGWAESDLAALEAAGTKQPQSFVAYPAKSAVNAWRKSIREAEALSALAGILTSRHFCLLAPRDGDPHHAAFVEEETLRRVLQEAASSIPRTDLDRFTAALGFCDLVSLCLCSGLTDAIQMPLAHAADPAAQHASRVTVSLAEQTIRLNQPAMTSGTVVYVDGWILSAPKVLASHRFQWTIG
jgi:hypothetical protein